MIYENQHFRYDSETGYLYRNEDIVSGNGKVQIKKGTRCSLKSDAGKYRKISFKNKSQLQHRVIWWVVYGYWPKQLDHKNGITYCNKLENLREVNSTINARNARLFKNNTSGHVGVSWESRRDKWAAHITVKNKHIYLGEFTHKDDAIRARKAANIKYNFSPRHGQVES